MTAQNTIEQPPELIPVSEVAKILGFCIRKVKSMDKSGLLPMSLKIGGSRRWRRADLYAWLAADCPPRRVWVEQRKDFV